MGNDRQELILGVTMCIDYGLLKELVHVHFVIVMALNVYRTTSILCNLDFCLIYYTMVVITASALDLSIHGIRCRDLYWHKKVFITGCLMYATTMHNSYMGKSDSYEM